MNFQVFIPDSGGVAQSGRMPDDPLGRLDDVGLGHLQLGSFSQHIPSGPNGAPVVLGDGNNWIVIPPDDAPSDPIQFQDCNDATFMFWCNVLTRNYQLAPEVVAALGLLRNGGLEALQATAGQLVDPNAVQAAAGPAAVAPRAPRAPGTVPWWYDYGRELAGVVTEAIGPELAEDGGSQLSIAFMSQIDLPFDPNTGAIECPIFGSIPAVAAAVSGSAIGLGPVVVVSDDGFEYFSTDDDLSRQAVKSDILSHVAHELAHSLTGTRTFWQSATADNIAAIVADIASPGKIERNPDGTLPWTGHGVDWLRASCWVVERLRQHGYPIDPVQNVFVRDYGYSDFAAYQKILAGEFAANTGTPIRQVLRTPAPIEFIRQWARDIGVKVLPLPGQSATPAPVTAKAGGTRTGKPLVIQATAVNITEQQTQPVEWSDAEFQALRRWLKAARKAAAV